MKNNFLVTILEARRADVARERREIPAAALEAELATLAPARDFRAAFRPERLNVIAELKKASPSKGLIREDFHPEALAPELEAAGAAALSILTEPHYFRGRLDYLRRVRKLVDLPLLRKDFIFDPYQILQARHAGADAVLLIAAMLDDVQLRELADAARHYGVQILAEIHGEAEAERVAALTPELTGINCRDLKTFATDLGLTEKLLRELPCDTVRIAESGLSSHAELRRFQALGANGFLIGETLMRAPEPGRKLEELLSCPSR